MRTNGRARYTSLRADLLNQGPPGACSYSRERRGPRQRRDAAIRRSDFYTTRRPNAPPWRTEVRAGMIGLVRPTAQAHCLTGGTEIVPRFSGTGPWTGSIARDTGRSFRGGDRRTFHVHPPNAREHGVSE